MTKEEAVRVLDRHNVCTIHGCKKVKGETHPYQQCGTENWVCPECQQERAITIAGEISEAKKVLGL